MNYHLRFFTRVYDSRGKSVDEEELIRYTYDTLPLVPRIVEIVVLEDIFPQIYKVVGVEYGYPCQTCAEDDWHDICVIVEATD